MAFSINGITRNNAGNLLASCEVFLLKYDSVGHTLTQIDHVISDAATAVYTFAGIADNAAAYTIISYKAGFPNVFDISDRNVQPQSLSVPVNTSLPSIGGSAVVGATLSADDGVWTGNPIPTFTRVWLQDATPIGGQTGTTYVVQSGDLGHTISVRTTGTNSQGSATATSNPTGTVITGGTTGWTVFSPSVDTQIIYVATNGSNANNGLSVNTPKQTVAAGVALLRSGFPDWLLLRKGDTFSVSSELFGSGKHGRSASEPMIIGSYHTSQPGVVDPAIPGGTRAFIRNSLDPCIVGWDYLAFVGIDFAPTAGGWGFHYTGSSLVAAPSAGNWLLFENCYLHGYFTNTIEYGFGSFIMRRCVVTDNSDQGLYIDRTVSVELTECIFDNNGSANLRVRNIYIEQTCLGATTIGLVTTRSSSTGIQSRCEDSIVRDSLSVWNSLGFQMGSLIENDPPGLVTTRMLIQDCVVMEGVDIGGTPQKDGIALFQMQGSGTSCLALNNIVCYQNAARLGSPYYSATAYDLEEGSGVHLTNNIAFDWRPEGTSPVVGNQSTSPGTTTLVWDLNSGTVYSGNNWDWDGSNNNNDGLAPNEPFPSPNRNLSTYLTSIGLSPATTQGYIDKVRLQSKDNWDDRLKAQSVNAYIRAGFGR